MPVYVRVMLVFSWVKTDGSAVYPKQPNAEDYNITGLNVGPGPTNWTESVVDGQTVYTYNSILQPGQTAANLIDSITYDQSNAPEGYVLNVDVMAQSVQAYPEQAVIELWGSVPGAASTQEDNK